MSRNFATATIRLIQAKITGGDTISGLYALV